MSKTGWTSVGELADDRRISPVAVCCSRASVRSRLRSCSSLNSRTFSMAITAWSAKVSRSAICFSENGRTSVRRIVNSADRDAFAQKRRSSIVRVPLIGLKCSRPPEIPSAISAETS